MAVELLLVVNALVAKQLATVGKITYGAGTGFDEHVLEVMADLVAEVAEHGPIRLAEANAKRLTVCIKRFDEVDRDHSVRVADDDPFSGAVAGYQVEGKAAVRLPVRVNRQPEVDELIHQPSQGGSGGHQFLHRDRVVSGGLATDQRMGHAAAALTNFVLVPRDQPVAPQARRLRASDHRLTINGRRARR